jgi:hypothetical protein
MGFVKWHPSRETVNVTVNFETGILEPSDRPLLLCKT